MKNAVVWDVTPCDSCKNRRFAGILFRRSVIRLLVPANVVSSSAILVTQMMEGIRSSETYVITRDTRRHTPEDGILQVSTLKLSNLTSDDIIFICDANLSEDGHAWRGYVHSRDAVMLAVTDSC
jgi:hypothetical protein